ncbi:hypothetical protein IGI37_003346 [Enterococcus sp. AZ194]|uniref:DUF916 and DUF3324 domain-containing protein n=1 Tax=Enterococcus sp. AZ194 TaxID=2774629 RepID=UPI003F26261F
MKQLKKWMWVLSVVIGILCAAETATAAQLNFAVTPVIPENQIDKEKTYFELKMKPEQVQTLDVELRNDTEKEVKVSVQVASATTNINGLVEYSPNGIKPDKSLKYNLKDLVQVDEEVTIKAKSKVNVPFKVSMPKESFDGILAGGITFKEILSEKDVAKEDEAGMAVKNEYAFAVGLVLQETDVAVEPDLKILEASASQVNARNVINVGFQNPNSTYLNQLRMSHEVTKQGESDVLYKSSAPRMQMAPNSNFEYPISLDGERLQAGKYQVKTVAYAGLTDKGKYEFLDEEGNTVRYLYKWEFEKDFEITAEVAKKLNAKDVTVEEEEFPWLYVIIGVLVLLIALLLLIIFLKRKKQDDGANTRRKTNTKKEANAGAKKTRTQQKTNTQQKAEIRASARTKTKSKTRQRSASQQKETNKPNPSSQQKTKTKQPPRSRTKK